MGNDTALDIIIFFKFSTLISSLSIPVLTPVSLMAAHEMILFYLPHLLLLFTAFPGKCTAVRKPASRNLVIISGTIPGIDASVLPLSS